MNGRVWYGRVYLVEWLGAEWDALRFVTNLLKYLGGEGGA